MKKPVDYIDFRQGVDIPLFTIPLRYRTTGKSHDKYLIYTAHRRKGGKHTCNKNFNHTTVANRLKDPGTALMETKPIQVYTNENRL